MNTSTTLIENFKKAYSFKYTMDMPLLRRAIKHNSKIVRQWNPHNVIELNDKVLFFDVIHSKGEYKFALSLNCNDNYDIRLYTKHFTPKFKVSDVELNDVVIMIDLIFKHKIKKFGV